MQILLAVTHQPMVPEPEPVWTAGLSRTSLQVHHEQRSGGQRLSGGAGPPSVYLNSSRFRFLICIWGSLASLASLELLGHGCWCSSSILGPWCLQGPSLSCWWHHHHQLCWSGLAPLSPGWDEIVSGWMETDCPLLVWLVPLVLDQFTNTVTEVNLLGLTVLFAVWT